MHGALPLTVIDTGLGDRLVRSFIDIAAFRPEIGIGCNRRVEKPKRHVHGLDILHPIVGGKGRGKKKPAFVKLFEGRHRVLLRLDEGDHIVGLHHAIKAAGHHRWITAVAALGGHSVLVADEGRAAGGTGKTLQCLRFRRVPFTARASRIPFSFLGLRRFRRPFLLFLEHFLHGFHGEFLVTVFTGDVCRPRLKTQRSCTVRAFISYRRFGHHPSLPYVRTSWGENRPRPMMTRSSQRSSRFLRLALFRSWNRMSRGSVFRTSRSTALRAEACRS